MVTSLILNLTFDIFSSTNQLKWGNELLKTINQKKDGNFLQLISIQLVGVCLFIFIKSSFASKIKLVTSSIINISFDIINDVIFSGSFLARELKQG